MNTRLTIPTLKREFPTKDMRPHDRVLIETRGIWNVTDLVTRNECPLCSCKSHRTVVTRQDGLPIQECNSCRLAYVDPRPSSVQLADYYENGYFLGEKDFFKGKDYCLERDKSINQGEITGYREIVANFEIGDKVILDVGCASGTLLQVLSQHDPKASIGVDTAAHPVAFGRSKYGLDLQYGTLHNANLPTEYFDLIIMIDVLEHIENLDSFLSEVRRILKPRGYIFILTPNYLAYSFAGDEWTCLHKDFEHLQYFSTSSAQQVCKHTGSTLIKDWTDSLPFRTFQYRKLYPHGAHRVFQPVTAVRNCMAQLKYKRSLPQMPSIGANLNLILRKE